jgi:hypothetical protein
MEANCGVLPRAKFRHTAGAILYQTQGHGHFLDGRQGKSMLGVISK